MLQVGDFVEVISTRFDSPYEKQSGNVGYVYAIRWEANLSIKVRFPAQDNDTNSYHPSDLALVGHTKMEDPEFSLDEMELAEEIIQKG